MTTRNDRTYRTSELARLAGVTVRALRHYDRLGLLKPPRTPAGYRLYSTPDLGVVRQIVALRAIGFPLAKIAGLRQAHPAAMAAALTAQREKLEEKRRLLDRVIQATRDTEARLQSGDHLDGEQLRRLTELVAVRPDPDGWQTAYDTLNGLWRSRRPSLSAAELREIGDEWETLVREVHGSVVDSASGPRTRALAARWLRLLTRLYGHEVPVSTYVVACDNISQWSRSAAAWPGWGALGKALAALPLRQVALV